MGVDSPGHGDLAEKKINCNIAARAPVLEKWTNSAFAIYAEFGGHVKLLIGTTNHPEFFFQPPSIYTQLPVKLTQNHSFGHSWSFSRAKRHICSARYTKKSMLLPVTSHMTACIYCCVCTAATMGRTLL